MDWSDSTLWWVITGGLIIVELATGTFYLLMLSLGASAAALAAWGSASFASQLIVASVVGGGAVVGWHLYRKRRAPSRAGPDVTQLDVGERVHVPHWNDHGDTRVHYRGSMWDARFVGSGTPQPGEHVIRAVEGTRLLLDR